MTVMMVTTAMTMMLVIGSVMVSMVLVCEVHTVRVVMMFWAVMMTTKMGLMMVMMMV